MHSFSARCVLYFRHSSYVDPFLKADTEALLAARLNEVGGSIHWNRTVKSITGTNEVIKKVTFEDGDVVEAKYIVAADGLHSIVRFFGLDRLCL